MRKLILGCLAFAVAGCAAVGPDDQSLRSRTRAVTEKVGMTQSESAASFGISGQK